MYLTIAELALAVDKSENYVRQHIHRKHLNARREGGNVTVALDDAARWTRERGLSFVLPAQSSVKMGSVKGRTARMTVLTWHPKDARPSNLFTHIRHRRLETLGPWANEPDGAWSSEKILREVAGESEKFHLHTLDTPFECCQETIDQILKEGTLEIDGLEIDYALKQIPRLHRAYRDQRPDADLSFRSPFSKHSAVVIEYWSFATPPQERWLDIIKLRSTSLPPLITRLGFPLDRRPDRIGNLATSRAEDEIDCELTATHNKTLVFNAGGQELLPGAYTATIWASHSGDTVLRQQINVTQGETEIDLQSEVDHIGFAVYRNVDGQCIDQMDVYLLMENIGVVNIETGPTLELHERSKSTITRLNPWIQRQMINISLDEHRIGQDKEIRRAFLDRKIHERETSARREGNLERFRPDQFDQAVEFFLRLLYQHNSPTEPIYLADPFLMHRVPKGAETQLYLRMFEATVGRPLLILCGRHRHDETHCPWWSSYPTLLTSHISARAFTRPSTEQNDPRFS